MSAPYLWLIVLSIAAFLFWDTAIAFGFIYILKRCRSWDYLDPVTFEVMKAPFHAITLLLTLAFTIWRIILWRYV